MKNIVICCDNAGNEYGENDINIVKTYSIAIKTDALITFYDLSIGTAN